ncbi:MAG TPA: SpoIIE family protein phosphatase [Allosphingosinicella sp.]|nr:SpoIIE family protein phosphatase [Allosphingosinicella sp.]
MPIHLTAAVAINRPLKVLIAEDDELMADYLVAVLRGQGHEVEVVPDGEAALDLLQEQKFDVLITDWIMPHMDGIELVRRAREQVDTYLHIMMMTARSQQRTAREALEAGADDLLYKPFDQTQIELGMATAGRVVQLERRLKRQNRHLSSAHQRTRAAFQRLRSDLVAAGKAQQRLLPEPKLDGPVRYSWSFKPSLQLGGDSLNVVPLPNERHLFFNIDVSGHGVPAALSSFALHHRLNQIAPREPDQLIGTLKALNAEVLEQAGEGYLTLILGIIEADGSRVWLSRAGHPMPLVVRRTGSAEYVEGGGMPVGLLPDPDFAVTEIGLEEGDRLLVYSDGVTDCGDTSCLGEDRLAELCSANVKLPVDELVQTLERALLDRLDGKPPPDDISMLMIGRERESGDGE